MSLIAEEDLLCLDADEEFVVFSRYSFWTSLFVRHFLEVADDVLRDDMLFYVRKSRAKSKSKRQQVALVPLCYVHMSANCAMTYHVCGQVRTLLR